MAMINRSEFMKNTYYIYRSALQSADIIKIINVQNVDLLSAGICGNAWGNQLSIYYKPCYANSFLPVFYGKISECENGTLITGNFKMFRFVKPFLWSFRAFAMLLLFGTLTAPFWADHIEGNQYIGIAVPIILIIFSFILEHLGSMLGKSGKKEVIVFIENKLLAHNLTIEN